MSITKSFFGETKDGLEVEKYTLTDGDYAVSVLTLGGIIQSLVVPDRNGILTDVVLGFDTVQAYEAQSCYLGALLGRCANRIAGSAVTVGETTFHLVCNDNGVCHLHGGNIGFDQKIWSADVADDELVLSYISPDGEEGYPGNLHVSVAYRLEYGALTLRYTAQSDKDTLCNLSNHAYFNLAGHNAGDVGEQIVQVYSDRYTPLGSNGAPNGMIERVDGTPLDLRQPTRWNAHWDDSFGQIVRAGGYDHNYLMDGEGMRLFARAACMENGIQLTVTSDLPGMQLYSGNYINNLQPGKDGAQYTRRSGFCMETQYPPNAVNCPDFCNPVLRKGVVYHHTTIYTFSPSSL